MANELDKDPTDPLRSLKIPIMIIGGGHDIQIRRPDYDALVSAAPQAKSFWYDDMDHLLKHETRSTKNLSEKEILQRYGDKRPIHPDLLDNLVSFLHDKLKCPSSD